MVLINRIEEEMDVFIPEEVVTLENFATVEKIASLVGGIKGN